MALWLNKKLKNYEIRRLVENFAKNLRKCYACQFLLLGVDAGFTFCTFVSKGGFHVSHTSVEHLSH